MCAFKLSRSYLKKTKEKVLSSRFFHTSSLKPVMYLTLTVTLSVLSSHKGLADRQWAARSKVTKSPGDGRLVDNARSSLAGDDLYFKVCKEKTFKSKWAVTHWKSKQCKNKSFVSSFYKKRNFILFNEKTTLYTTLCGTQIMPE